MTSSDAAAATMKKVPIPANGVDYRGKVVLAPMVRSGELPSRLLALHYGADLVWGPETVDHALIGTTRHVNPTTGMIEFTKPPPNAHPSKKNLGSPPAPQLIYRLDPVRERRRLIFQLGTSDPSRAVAAARLVAPDVAGIDVNAGCPKPFSTSGGMGAALLKTPDKLCAILRALVEAVVPEFEVGVSVKIRLLETPAETESLVRALCRTGITGLTIHCRTAPMRKTEPVKREQLRMIVGVCREYGVACLINGDVTGRDEGVRLAEEYGADGAMIATAAEKNSSCFRTAEQGGLAGWREVVERYLRFAMEVENKFGNTKYLLNILIPGREPVLKKTHGAQSYVAVCELLGYTDLIEQARVVDDRLGLSPEAKAREKAAKEAAVQEKIREQQIQQKQEKQQKQQQASKRKYSDSSPRSRSPPRKVLVEREGNGNRNAVPEAPAQAAPAATFV
ncbi:tRNA-dihydrouridine synthase [Coniochaeta ligniaria NRRL 30616]|uniref:tRNA-dihydrouridine synthase n=1 Tax=Coniochaeta ligniaria NRRL 30616 TaxID=1408157 RepID=A0A1J7K4V0_9PEZI|nr:tRNA-dihydrouridine synthase [Coniochaeta ligniaria NRRL 30616]